MIYEMSRDIEAGLQARKYPYPVEYGPELPERQDFAPRILIERDPEASDSVGAPQGQNRNPRRLASRALAVRARVFVQSTLVGAHVGDHERECEYVVDALIAELDAWTTEHKTLVVYGPCRYLTGRDLGGLEQWPGRAYELKFTIGRGVYRRNYDGGARPTGAAVGVANQTRARYADSDDPEIGCGA